MSGLNGITKANENSALKKADEPKSEYGKTVGEPKLSDEGKKYYEQLKKKYGNYDFVLVSADQKENAKANAAKYANPFKTVVLIDEEKIEKMATDTDFRKKYEDILSGATTQLEQLKQSMEKSGSNVKGFGMQVNDNGTASFFAVLKKSSSDQKARIEKKAVEKREARKADEKAAAKKLAEKANDERKAEKAKAEKKAENARTENANFGKRTEKADGEDTVTISANSIEELMAKIEDYNFAQRSDSVLTESEKLVGQNIDFRG